MPPCVPLDQSLKLKSNTKQEERNLWTNPLGPSLQTNLDSDFLYKKSQSWRGRRPLFKQHLPRTPKQIRQQYMYTRSNNDPALWTSQNKPCWKGTSLQSNDKLSFDSSCGNSAEMCPEPLHFEQDCFVAELIE